MDESIFTFIIGSQKSGTTWLRNCLRHWVAIDSPEWYYPDLYCSIKRHVDRYGGALSSADRADRSIRMARAAWRELIGDFGGDKSAYPSAPDEWVNSDVYPFAVAQSREHFPNAKIVLIIRDPRAVYNSLQYYLNNFPNNWSIGLSPQSFAANWQNNNK